MVVETTAIALHALEKRHGRLLGTRRGQSPLVGLSLGRARRRVYVCPTKAADVGRVLHVARRTRQTAVLGRLRVAHGGGSFEVQLKHAAYERLVVQVGLGRHGFVSLKNEKEQPIATTGPSITHPMNAMQLMRPSRPVRAVRVCAQSDNNKSKGESRTTRRELALRSVNLLALAAMFTWGASPTPSNIGLSDYGEFKSLALCPPSPNCISTSEEANDMTHYVPQWTYNPEEGRGTKNPATQEQAMNELVEVVESTSPDGFTPKIVKRTAVGVFLLFSFLLVSSRFFSFLLVSSRFFSFLAGRSSGEQRRPGVGLVLPRSLTRSIARPIARTTCTWSTSRRRSGSSTTSRRTFRPLARRGAALSSIAPLLASGSRTGTSTGSGSGSCARPSRPSMGGSRSGISWLSG